MALSKLRCYTSANQTYRDLGWVCGGGGGGGEHIIFAHAQSERAYLTTYMNPINKYVVDELVKLFN